MFMFVTITKEVKMNATVFKIKASMLENAKGREYIEFAYFVNQ